MIKVFWFGRNPTAPWAGGFPEVESQGADGRPIAPVRRARNIVLTSEHETEPVHGVIDSATFEDLHHADRWRRAIEGDVAASPYDPGVVAAGTEVVLRGQEWLANRWTDGGSRFKHVALARRADGLNHEEFEARWKAHAGTAGSTPIPAELRGLAYVQNHTSIGGAPGADAPYDAINEVWFDDLDLLRARHRWLGDNLPPPENDELFGERHLLLVEETPVEGPSADLP